jgi:hypothetical protein
MNDMNLLYLVIALSVLVGILGIILYISRKELADTREAWDAAIYAAERADERASIMEHAYNDFIQKPYQVLVPEQTVEILAHHVINYLSATEKK